MTIRPILLIAALAAVLLPESASAQEPPVDHTKIDGLSTVGHETRRESVRLPAFDGKELYLEIVRPRAEGHFPVGSTPTLAAAQSPQGLATIVPSAGLASMYHHQFQGGVPYWLQ